ncbi:UNVERIFIED_ORG: hypothetical protein FNL38_105127 [Nocardia globerula]|uniref:Uncharacterized protein n=1 Tax=Nocardia globerula TaxID=1818 RepID=A0A652YMA3_NOCGL
MILTLAAGLASTAFAPLAAPGRSIRLAYNLLGLSMVLALVTIPGHVWGLRGRWPDPIRLPHAHLSDHRIGRYCRSSESLGSVGFFSP